MFPHRGIVHVVQRLAPGGIETLVRDLAMGDPEQTTIVSLEGTVTSLVAAWPALAQLQHRIVALDRQPGLSFGLIWRLARLLKQLRPATLFAHHIGPLIYAGIAARLARVQTIVHVEHDVWHYTTPRARDLTSLIEYVVRPRHVAVSRHAANEILSFLPRADVTVIHNGIDVETYKPTDKQIARDRFGLPMNRKIVGTVGRLTKVKGHAVLLQAAAILPDETHIVIAGAGECRAQLGEIAQSCGIARRVTFLGHVENVHELLPAFDLFCLPSFAEGFPRSVIEAQACGIPVVASAVGALDEAIDATAGSLVPAGDPIALSRSIQAVLARPANPDVWRFVAERFSWDRTFASYRCVAEAPHAR